ncbi:hypothetical protein Tco_0392904 [Tanacetum coccineum]
MFSNMIQSYLNQTWHDKMSDENVPAPIRTDEQLVPVKARLPIGKSNLLMDLQKKQKNPIFLISVDILQNTNFFNAFTASVDVLWESPLRILHTLLWHLLLAADTTFTKGHSLLFTLQLITIHEYYQKYLDMAARKPRQATTVTDEEGGKEKKAPLAGKSKKPAPAKQPKPVRKKPSKPTPSRKIRKQKRSDHLVDEADEEPQLVSKPQVEDDEYNLQRGIQMSLESFQAPVGEVAIRKPDSGITQKLPVVEGKGKGITSDELACNIRQFSEF